MLIDSCWSRLDWLAGKQCGSVEQRCCHLFHVPPARNLLTPTGGQRRPIFVFCSCQTKKQMTLATMRYILLRKIYEDKPDCWGRDTAAPVSAEKLAKSRRPCQPLSSTMSRRSKPTPQLFSRQKKPTKKHRWPSQRASCAWWQSTSSFAMAAKFFFHSALTASWKVTM